MCVYIALISGLYIIPSNLHICLLVWVVERIAKQCDTLPSQVEDCKFMRGNKLNTERQEAGMNAYRKVTELN